MTTPTPELTAMARAILANRVGMGDAADVVASVMEHHEETKSAEWIEALRDATAAQSAPTTEGRGDAEKAGWKLVPVEPTEAMVDVGSKLYWSEHAKGTPWLEAVAKSFRAMLAASPTPPIPASETSANPPSAVGGDLEAIERLIYAVDPIYEEGESVEGFRVSPGGYLSWEAFSDRAAEFGDDKLFHAYADRMAMIRKTANQIAALTPPAPAVPDELIADGRYPYVYHDHSTWGRVGLSYGGGDFIQVTMMLENKPGARWQVVEMTPNEAEQMALRLLERVTVARAQKAPTDGK